MKWTELYHSEQELIEDMMKAKADEKKYYHYQLVRGYMFIDGFQKWYREHGYLTDGQLRQLKRLAASVYANTHLQA